MGFYSKASSTEDLASRSVAGIISQVVYPLYSAVQDDKERLISVLKRVTAAISYVTTPMMVILLLVAKPLFVLLYSDKWLPCVPYFQLLCLAGVAVCLQSVNNQTLAAIGKSRIMFRWTIIKRSVGIVALIIGISVWGIYGLLVAVVFDNWFTLFVNMANVSKYVGYGFKEQILSIIPTFATALIGYAVAYFGVNAFHLGMYADGAAKFLVFAIIYVSWSLLRKPDAFTYFLSLVQSLKLKK